MSTFKTLSSQSTFQQIAPTQVVDSLATTIQVSGNNVIATLVLPQSWFDAGLAQERLGVFANAIGTIMADGKVTAATSSQTLDQNGQLQDSIDFTVAYTPPNSVVPLTRVVTVLSSNIGGTGLGTGAVGPTYAESLIDAAYSQLEALAQGG